MQDYLVIATLAFLLAGTIKGTVGIGLPTAAIGILGQFVEPHLAISLTILPILTANIWQIWTTSNVLQVLRKFWLCAGTLVVFMLAASQFVTALPSSVVAALVGISVVIFAGTNLLGVMPRLPERFDFAGQGIAGSIAGVMGGLTGMWGPPLFIYFLARHTPKQEFVGTIGVLLFIGGLPMVIGYWQAGLLNSETAPASALLIIPTLLGFGLGARIRARLDADRFRNLLLIAFLVMGLNLIRKAIFG